MNKILVVDDERVMRFVLTEKLKENGFAATEAPNGFAAVELLKKESFDALLLDLKMPKMNGIETLQEIRKLGTDIPVIMITAHGDIPTAVEAIKLGAYDFIEKPPQINKLVLTLNRAIEGQNLKREVVRLHMSVETSLERILGKSPAIKKIIEQLQQIAPSDLSVIIQGETGTGKTLLAKLLHGISRRADKEFVKVDLGAMPETIIESELFGYEKGAYTGAVQSNKGFFETANGGSVFLDDIENLSAFVQSKLLGVLENRELYRLGSRKPVNLDIRIISATNKNIRNNVLDGSFREDLFFRLGEFIVTLPPLRERKEDIPHFVRKFLEAAASELNIPAIGINSEAMDHLAGYHWPGNIRELKSVIKRAVLLSKHKEITMDHIDFLLEDKQRPDDVWNGTPLKDAVSSLEMRLLKKTLALTKGNKAKTASILQIDVKTLRSKMSEYGIN